MTMGSFGGMGSVRIGCLHNIFVHIAMHGSEQITYRISLFEFPYNSDDELKNWVELFSSQPGRCRMFCL